jgi:Ca2+-binding RTX toxin-like protein
MNHKRILLAACAAALLTPGTAMAATVTRATGGTLVYTADPGRANSVNVQSDDSREITFYTAGGDPIGAIAAGCTRSDIYPDEVVTCAPGSAVRVELGDGDDRGVISEAVSVPVVVAGGTGNDVLDDGLRSNSLDGGAGDDRLNGGAGDDRLLGGDGNDDLQGKAGRDHLDGGAGDDLLHPDGHEDASADVIDGGPGHDTIDDDYSSRFTDVDPPLAITLAGGADDGRPGEGDDIINVEKIELNIRGRYIGTDGPDEIKLAQITDGSELIGAGGDDRLRGADGPDRLEGGPGDDTLDAGYGNDIILGGPGRDTISADLAGGDCGPYWCKHPHGNDTINAADGEIDTIACGPGQDTVNADAADIVAPDCETVTRGTPPAPAAPTAPGSTPTKLTLIGRVRLAAALRNGIRIRVTAAKPGRLTLTARLGRRTVARGTTTIGATGQATIRVRFTANARRELRHKRRIKLTITGGPTTLKTTIRH